jgi:SET domain-containing protein
MLNYYINTSPEMGRGLYAAQDLQQNRILFTAELLVLSENDTIKVNETDLKWYTFKYTDKQDCLVLGDGEIFNHSDMPNVGYRLIDYDDRQVMAFYLLRDVSTGSQLFIDYGADIAVDTSKYTVNMF